MFFIEIIFQFIIIIDNIYTHFFTHTVCCIIRTLVFFLIVPETKEKSQEDIQDIFNEMEVKIEDDRVKMRSLHINYKSRNFR